MANDPEDEQRSAGDIIFSGLFECFKEEKADAERKASNWFWESVVCGMFGMCGMCGSRKDKNKKAEDKKKGGKE
jgi:hypothetical protein